MMQATISVKQLQLFFWVRVEKVLECHEERRAPTPSQLAELDS